MESYSKWNKFVAELSDDSDEDENYPRVTKFDKEGGESIEIGKEGYTVKNDIEDFDLNKSEMKNKNIITNKNNYNSKDDSLNGYSCDQYFWSQDRYEVRISFYILDDTVKSKDLLISLEGKRFILKNKINMFVIVDKEFQYDIDIASDESIKTDFTSLIDWEIKSKEFVNDQDNLIEFKRFIEFTFRKKSPIPGAFIWWSNVFVGDHKIDVSNLSGRKSESNDKNMEAWNEAHKMFMQKVASREKVEVDFEDDA